MILFSVTDKDLLNTAWIYYALNRRILEDGIQSEMYEAGIFDTKGYSDFKRFRFIQKKYKFTEQDWMEFVIDYNKNWEHLTPKWKRRYRIIFQKSFLA